jgi:hypothetical protein
VRDATVTGAGESKIECRAETIRQTAGAGAANGIEPLRLKE